MIDASPATTRALPYARVFACHGVPIGVRSNDPAVLERVPAFMPTGWTELASPEAALWYGLDCQPLTDGGRVLYQLFEDGQLLDEGFRLTRLLDRLESGVRLQVGRLAPDRLFVHAGVVEWKGRCIVMPGPSGAGKTTLVAALVRAGAAYCSDEYAVLDSHGVVHPYARPLAIKLGVHRRVQRHAAADLGGQLSAAPAPIGLVVITAYRPLAQWAPRTISSGAAALALFANTLAARERPAAAFSVFSRALAGVVALEGDRGEAEAAAASILNRAGQRSPPFEAVIHEAARP